MSDLLNGLIEAVKGLTEKVEAHQRCLYDASDRLQAIEERLDRMERPSPYSVEHWPGGPPLEREVASVATGPTERGREAISRHSAQGDRAAQ